MNYLSTQIQPKTNLIIFGILLGKFISHWILLAYMNNMCAFSSLHQLNDICKNWWSLFLLQHRFEHTLSCTKPVLHAQSFAHVVHAFLNDIYIGKLLIQFKHLGKETISSFLFFSFFPFFFFWCKSQTFPYIMKDIAKFYLIYIWLNLNITHWSNPI